MSGADRVLYDKDIREPLFFFLEETYGKIRILEEKRTGSARVDFYVIREAADNPKVKDKRKITILWRTELNRLLERNKLPKYLQRSKQFVQEKLIERVPGDVLWPQAYDELFERDYNTIEQEIEDFRRERRSR